MMSRRRLFGTFGAVAVAGLAGSAAASNAQPAPVAAPDPAQAPRLASEPIGPSGTAWTADHRHSMNTVSMSGHTHALTSHTHGHDGLGSTTYTEPWRGVPTGTVVRWQGVAVLPAGWERYAALDGYIVKTAPA